MHRGWCLLIYTVELLEAFDDPEKHEQEMIWEYLKETSSENVDSTESGIYYIKENPGTGDLFTDGNHVNVWYTGKFLDGRIFDSNIGEKEYLIIVPGSNNIAGWQEGIKLMKNGEQGTLIIPYDLGYGEQGRYDEYGRVVIPPYMTLVFEMETELTD
jgi:FKBP-type peptidyl-prolyl cis-trans isomerase FkpA